MPHHLRAMTAAAIGLALYASASLAGAQSVLFTEDFHSGLGQFTSYGAAGSGGGAAFVNGCVYGCFPGALVSEPINTQGFTNLKLSYDRTAAGLDLGEYAVSAFSVNGGAWTALERIANGSGRVTIPLPGAAANKASVRLRFRINATVPTEYLWLDNVMLEGTSQAGPGDPDGASYQNGPDPSTDALEAASGPFAYAQAVIPPVAASGYGGGTIYYPTGATGPFAAVAVVPGYLASQSTIAWWGPRLASHGFVVFTIDTLNILDLPANRATQLMAALNQLVNLSATPGRAVSGLVDPARLGVVGWSYGGGGTLLAAQGNPQLKAAIALAPKTLAQSSFTGTTVPTLIAGCQADTTAPPLSWAIPFYETIVEDTHAAYLEMRGGDHFCVTSSTTDADKRALGKYGVAWLKRFMDNDFRYTPFLCGQPHQDDLAGSPAISGYRENCPY